MTTHEMEKSNVQPYHYLDCGLDDVWLIGGVSREETPYGLATSIDNIDELHKVIGLSIAYSQEMSGKEFRFLRIELDLSQRTLAKLLRATEQQIHRWENGKCEIPGPAQIALAGYFLETCDPDSRSKELLDKLAELDAELSTIEARNFTVSNGIWMNADAA